MNVSGYSLWTFGYHIPRLVVEVPDIDPAKIEKPKTPVTSAGDGRRQRPGPIAYVDESEGGGDDVFPNDYPRSAALARKLQREDDESAAASFKNAATSANEPPYTTQHCACSRKEATS
ncbi:hypothetical protein F5Y13DRAFT_187012 [Hypoxylon sp. FL1857]|nr:hypothetical protein F5Y13DRAFT_187012 [Hypoxylon sp. FL1857]